MCLDRISTLQGPLPCPECVQLCVQICVLRVCLCVSENERHDLCQHHSLGHISHNCVCVYVNRGQVVSRGRLRPWTSTSWPQRMWWAAAWTWERPASLSESMGSRSRACLRTSTQTVSSSPSSASLQGSSEYLFVSPTCWLKLPSDLLWTPHNLMNLSRGSVCEIANAVAAEILQSFLQAAPS